VEIVLRKAVGVAKALGDNATGSAAQDRTIAKSRFTESQVIRRTGPPLRRNAIDLVKHWPPSARLARDL